MIFIPVIVVLLIIGFIVISSRPKNFCISRSVTINAPASKSFAQVNDFHKWLAWSPWEKLDPNTQRTYGGSSEGVGATYAWSGNGNVGSGTMKITESTPHSFIKLDLNFEKPFKASNVTEFTFVETDGKTVVTQSMMGCNSFMGKLMSLVMNMDKMIGTKFDEGLAVMKTVAESQA